MYRSYTWFYQTFTIVLLSCSLILGLETGLQLSEVVLICSLLDTGGIAPLQTSASLHKRDGGVLFDTLCTCFYFTDVQDCNVVDREVYYYDGNCSLQQVPGDDIVYVTQNKEECRGYICSAQSENLRILRLRNYSAQSFTLTHARAETLTWL